MDRLPDPNDLSIAAIHARVEADRPALMARLEHARQHELPAIRARIEADRPALMERIEWARQHELPAIRERIEADRAARGLTSSSTAISASEAFAEAQAHTSRASAGLSVARTVMNFLR